MLILALLVLGTLGGGNGIARKELESYTWNIGNALFDFSQSATKHRELHKKFEMSESKVVPISLDNIFYEVANRMNESLRKKVDAIEKIMLFAEEKALDHYNHIPDETFLSSVTFYNSKSLNVTLTPDDHFQAEVNTGFSSVHVPTSIYEEDKKLLEAIGWSSDLDASFKSNYKENPTLSWQYFGSSTGFLRHFPATKWPKGDTDSNEDNEDLYDCRMRPWYVGAANTPKNIMILQDVSGSMTGLRSQIAKHVIHTILDTLIENDFVNVYNFSNNSIPLVDCFKNRLVQANLENVRQFKIALDQGDTRGFANTSKAIETAFDILDVNYRDEASSRCNQAIMIISDGSSEHYKDLFLKRNPSKKVRVFTFLIGREVTDFREVLWMACYNKGYYSHISTMGEVQEEVLKYLPVMSRPLVMSEQHHVSWSSVYAHLAEIIESDWLWENKTRNTQRERSDRYKTFYQTFLAAKKDNKSLMANFTTQEEMDAAKPGHLPNLVHSKVKNYLDHAQTNVSESLVRKMRAEKERNITSTRLNRKHFDSQFKFVVSASIPVFDKRKTNSTYDNERIANFLGVVGTDIPVKELQKITSPFHLGVNGYAFAITNNGHIVFHPDWRPLYDDILRPNYNTVDLTQVELVHSDDYERNRAPQLLDMRKAMIDKDTQNSSTWTLHVRSHGDNFRRVKIREQQYAFGKIDGTSYTLALTIPTNAHRFVGAVEIWRLRKDRQANANATRYFESPTSKQKWRLNPNWSYCEYIDKEDDDKDMAKKDKNKDKEDKDKDLLIHFLQRIQQSNYSWAWTATNASRRYICDKDLVQSLVFDAELTQKFAPDANFLRSSALGNATVMTFVATRSGLTRWIDIDAPDPSDTDIPFLKYYGRATEELWYKRAVDWYEIDDETFVFSVPFDAGTRSVSQVTATQAIFVKKEGLKAPVGVVGLQLDLDKLLAYLNFSLPLIPGRAETYSKRLCQSNDFDCFMLDDNGFIVISENRDDIGQFFGEVDGKVMRMLITERIYDEIAVTDFQAVCLHPLIRSNFADILATPLRQFKWLINWFLGRMAYLILQFNLQSFINPDYASVLADYADSDEMQGGESAEGSMPYIRDAYVLKTKLRPCDKKYKLYSYGTEFLVGNASHHHPIHDSCEQKCDDFLNVQRIPHTNLILVVVQAKCRCGHKKVLIDGVEIEYEMYPEFVGKTELNPILLELCRIPYSPLYRKRVPYCYASEEQEGEMKKDCGSGSSSLEHTYFWMTILLIQYCCITQYY